MKTVICHCGAGPGQCHSTLVLSPTDGQNIDYRTSKHLAWSYTPNDILLRQGHVAWAVDIEFYLCGGLLKIHQDTPSFWSPEGLEGVVCCALARPSSAE